MKTCTLLLLAAVLASSSFAQSGRRVEYVNASELTVDIMTPTSVSFIDRAKRHDGPTCGLIETAGGKRTLSTGAITLKSRGDNVLSTKSVTHPSHCRTSATT